MERTTSEGIVTEYGYNHTGLLEQLCHKNAKGMIESYQYDYDAVGNRIREKRYRKDMTEENGIYTYGYDNLQRLTHTVKDGVEITGYCYDGFGNRIEKRSAGNITHYHYNALNQLVRDINGSTEHRYEYDNRGNLIRRLENGRIQHEYEFGAMNRMTKAVDSLGTVAEYHYNGLGHRTGMQQRNSRVEYILDFTKNYHNLLQKEENGEIQSYIWDSEAVFLEANGQCYSYLNDMQGSTMRLLNHSGESSISYRYDAFGADLVGNQGHFQPFGYTGYQMDNISGTYYAQAREYDAWSGRFTSEDVVKGNAAYPNTLNAYGYCWGNPIKYVDRDGESPIVAIGAAALIGMVIDLAFQTVDNIKEKNKWYDYDWNEACIAGAGAILGTIVFMVAPSIAVAVVGTGASAGVIVAATMGVVAIGNFVVGAGMSILDDYIHDVDKEEMFKNAIISGVSSAIFSLLSFGWNMYNRGFKSIEKSIEHDLFNIKYDKHGLEGVYVQWLKEDMTQFLIMVYGYDIGSAIAQNIIENTVKEECLDE